MRRSELTAEQLQRRSKFIERLRQAGWTDGRENEVFDEGRSLDCEATMEFAREDVELRLDYCASRDAVEFSLEDARGRGITLSLPFDDSIDEIINVFVGMQDVVSVSNFQEHANAIVKVAPKTVILLEDETIPLARGPE
jgi:hypothetical protein